MCFVFRKRAYRKKWDEANPDANKRWYAGNAEQRRQQARDWYRANPERARETQRRYKQRHPERLKEWQTKNRDKQRTYKQQRRARVLQGGGSFTVQEWRDLCDRYGNRCVCCGQDRPLTADHVVPVSKGGTSYIENMQPLCGPCNSAKSDQAIDYRPDKGAGIERRPKPARKTPKVVRWHRAYEVSPRGEAAKRSKLTEEQVREIRRRYYEDRHTFTQIAKDFGIDRSTASRIIKGVTWSHI